VGDNSNFVFRQKLVGEDGSVRRCVVMVKQPGLFSPKLGTMSSHFFTQSPQNFTVEPGIHSLAVGTNSLCTIPLMSKKVMIMLLRLLFTCLAFFGLGDVRLCHWEDCRFVSGS